MFRPVFLFISEFILIIGFAVDKDINGRPIQLYMSYISHLLMITVDVSSILFLTLLLSSVLFIEE